MIISRIWTAIGLNSKENAEQIKKRVERIEQQVEQMQALAEVRRANNDRLPHKVG